MIGKVHVHVYVRCDSCSREKRENERERREDPVPLRPNSHHTLLLLLPRYVDGEEKAAPRAIAHLENPKRMRGEKKRATPRPCVQTGTSYQPPHPAARGTTTIGVLRRTKERHRERQSERRKKKRRIYNIYINNKGTKRKKKKKNAAPLRYRPIRCGLSLPV